MTVTSRLLELRVRPCQLGLWAVPALASVGLLDSTFDVAVRLTLLYLLPVALGAWVSGRRTGLALGVLAAFAEFVADLVVAPDRWVIALWNLPADLLVYLSAALLLSGLRARLTQAHRDARTDALTGVLNVRAFRDAAESELTRSRRHGRPISLALIDLDRFKQVNDVHGHSAGDDVLRATARQLELAVRASDVVARIGGDEFAVLLPEADHEAATSAAAHLGAGTDTGPHHVDFSVGVASFDQPPSTVDELLACADRAMYVRKRAGRTGA
jgi:diguanylate cyclase (GGDEF)-like protein